MVGVVVVPIRSSSLVVTPNMRVSEREIVSGELAEVRVQYLEVESVVT